MHKILISAYACEPGKGSEQGVGWHWVLEMAKTEKLWVITRSNNKEAIDKGLPEELSQNIKFIYYDLPEKWKRFKNKEKGLYLYYLFWQWGAYLQAKQLVEQIDFDYCQHLTFGNMWLPTFMYKLPIPFILGPVGGGEAVPFGLIKCLPAKGRLSQYLRYFLIKLVAIAPFSMRAASSACAIIVRTEDSRRALPKKFRGKVWLMLETGMARSQLDCLGTSKIEKTNRKLTIIFTGRLVAFKNVAMAIKAFAEVCLTNKDINFVIVGGGSQKKSLERLVSQLDLNQKTQFKGVVTQQETIQLLRSSDIFLFPSLREGGSWSLMEAMAVGLPTICVDSSGMSVMTDEHCAIRIEPTNPADMQKEMERALTKLVASEELRRSMGQSAQRRVETEFLWDKKGEFMRSLFSEIDELLKQKR